MENINIILHNFFKTKKEYFMTIWGVLFQVLIII